MPRYKHGKIRRSMGLKQLETYMRRVKESRERKELHYLGVDPLRDKSLLAILFWTGLRIAEIVGDRERRYKVSRFTKDERLAMKMQRIDWKALPDPYRIKTSPERRGIRAEDIEEREERLFITAEALKQGKRDAPLELPLDLPYVYLIKEQWRRTEPGEKVWNLSREYAWGIVKEIDPRIYIHFFRFNRATQIARNPSTSPLHLLNWFGWIRLQTAYKYFELAGRYQKETAEVLREQK